MARAAVVEEEPLLRAARADPALWLPAWIRQWSAQPPEEMRERVAEVQAVAQEEDAAAPHPDHLFLPSARKGAETS